MDWTDIFATRTQRMKASEIRELLDQPDIISFAGGLPKPELSQAGVFQAAFTDALSEANKDAALQYSVSEGHLGLCKWIVAEMGRIGGAVLRGQHPDNLRVTADAGLSWQADAVARRYRVGGLAHLTGRATRITGACCGNGPAICPGHRTIRRKIRGLADLIDPERGYMAGHSL